MSTRTGLAAFITLTFGPYWILIVLVLLGTPLLVILQIIRAVSDTGALRKWDLAVLVLLGLMLGATFLHLDDVADIRIWGLVAQALVLPFAASWAYSSVRTKRWPIWPDLVILALSTAIGGFYWAQGW